MKKSLPGKLVFLSILAALWLALYGITTASHRRAYNLLLGGDTPAALDMLRFTATYEPNFFLHRGRMGRAALAGAFEETGRLIKNRLSWTLDTGSPVFSSPAFSDGFIYFGDSSGTVYKVDADSGNIAWRSQTGGAVETKPLAAEGKIFVAAHDGIHSIDKNSGEKIWFRKVRWAESSPAYATGTVYAGTDDGRMLAMRAEDGTMIWEYTADGPVESDPIIEGGRLYFGSNRGTLYAVDAARGHPVWSAETGGRMEGRPLAAHGKVFAGSTTGAFYAFNADNGETEWKKELDGSIESGAADAGDTIIVGTKKGTIYALDAATGNEVWKYIDAGPVETVPAVDGKTVYMGTHYGFILALDVATGKKAWSFLTGWDIDESSPLVIPGLVIEGSIDGRVYAIEKK